MPRAGGTFVTSSPCYPVPPLLYNPAGTSVAPTMITYRDLISLDDLQACIDLQTRVWGFDPVDVVPLPILLVTGKYGGFLHGAFDGDRLVGFVYSLPARGFHRWLQWSHMLAVDPAYQGMGIGAAEVSSKSLCPDPRLRFGRLDL